MTIRNPIRPTLNNLHPNNKEEKAAGSNGREPRDPSAAVFFASWNTSNEF